MGKTDKKKGLEALCNIFNKVVDHAEDRSASEEAQNKIKKMGFDAISGLSKNSTKVSNDVKNLSECLGQQYDKLKNGNVDLPNIVSDTGEVLKSGLANLAEDTTELLQSGQDSIAKKAKAVKENLTNKWKDGSIRETFTSEVTNWAVTSGPNQLSSLLGPNLQETIQSSARAAQDISQHMQSLTNQVNDALTTLSQTANTISSQGLLSGVAAGLDSFARVNDSSSTIPSTLSRGGSSRSTDDNPNLIDEDDDVKLTSEFNKSLHEFSKSLCALGPAEEKGDARAYPNPDTIELRGQITALIDLVATGGELERASTRDERLTVLRKLKSGLQHVQSGADKLRAEHDSSALLRLEKACKRLEKYTDLFASRLDSMGKRVDSLWSSANKKPDSPTKDLIDVAKVKLLGMASRFFKK